MHQIEISTSLVICIVIGSLAIFNDWTVTGLEVFNPNQCRGCRSDFECAKNAACIPVSMDSDCGVCVCNDGYEPVGVKRCRKVPKSKTKTSKRAKTTSTSVRKDQDVIVHPTSQRRTSTSTTKLSSTSTSSTTTTTTATSTTTPETSTSTSTSTTAATSTTTTSTPSTIPSTTLIPSTTTTTTITTTIASRTSPRITQGPIPILFALNCADYDCAVEPEPSIDESPLTVKTSMLDHPSTDCKSRIIHDRVACNSPLASNSPYCNGVYCLDNEDTQSSYCICPFDKIGSSCVIDKPGKCSHGTGLLPIDQILRKDTRFVHKNMPELGDIVARHFASSWIECIKLCQWTYGQCKAINFGQISNSKVCELLSVAVTKDNTMLQSWLQEQTGWTYVCCF